MSPIITVVAPLNPDIILPSKLSLSKEMFICLKAGSCNRSVALSRSTSTLCTSKSLIHSVSTSASWCGLGRVNRGKGYRAVNWLNCSVVVWDVDGVHLGPGCGCLQQPPLLALRLILIVNRAIQYVVYGGSRFRQELCTGRYYFNRWGGLSSVDRLSNISPEVADPD